MREMSESYGYRWTGVNYSEGLAMDVQASAAANGAIRTYDGRNLPFQDQQFDIVYSHQVFEHIQSIESTFREIARVLRPAGYLIGSVSYMEQFHDHSTFNMTPFGFKLACEQAGMRVLRLYPRYDVFTWMLRRLMVMTDPNGIDESSLTSDFGDHGTVSKLLISHMQRLGRSIRDINLLRLLFAPQFTFEVYRP